jgi:hypothetical protein
MHAEARIHVERAPSALQVPVQALAEADGRYFTLVKNAGTFEMREIHIGSTNDKVATIETGLMEGDEVVMNPRNAGQLFELPSAHAAALASGTKQRPVSSDAPLEKQSSTVVEASAEERTGG